MISIKTAGTPLDRRSKSMMFRSEICDLYKRGVSTKEISQLYKIKPLQVWRYVNYEKYLEQSKKDSCKYSQKQKKLDNQKFRSKQIRSRLIHDQYIQYLIQCKHKFCPDIK